MSLTTHAPFGGERQRVRAPDPATSTVTMTTGRRANPLRVSLLVCAGGGQICRRLAAAVHRHLGPTDVGGQSQMRETLQPPTDIGRFGQSAQRHWWPTAACDSASPLEQLGLLGLDHAHHEGVDPHLGVPTPPPGWW